MTTHETTPPPLRISDLAFGYHHGRAVIDSLTADLHPGRITALLGPNAVGKSTLLRLVMGQLIPRRGSVSLLGKDVSHLSFAQRARVLSYVPQRTTASFAFTVEQVVEMGRYALPADRSAVRQALESCDLEPLAGRVFNELSVGQQQRVLLARALAQAAGGGKVMLLDEPGSAMDLWHTHHTMSLLAQCADRGMAILVVVHDLNLAARYAQDIWLMHGGRIAAAGAWDVVLNPQTLEPVYGVKLTELRQSADDRPMFGVTLDR